MNDLPEAVSIPVASNRRSKLGVVALLLVLGARTLALSALFVTEAFIYPRTDAGRCLVFDKHDCIEVSRDAIEEVAGIALPEGAEIVDSGSGRSLKSGITRALVRLGAETDVELGDAFEPCTPPSHCVPSHVTEYLSQRGLEVERSLIALAGSSIVTYATDDNGDRWVLIRVIWDG